MQAKRSIDIIFLAKLHGITFAFAGLVAGILYSVGGAIIDFNTTGFNGGTILAFGAVIGMPLIFGTVGLVLGITEGLIYNFLSRWIPKYFS